MLLSFSKSLQQREEGHFQFVTHILNFLTCIQNYEISTGMQVASSPPPNFAAANFSFQFIY